MLLLGEVHHLVISLKKIYLKEAVGRRHLSRSREIWKRVMVDGQNCLSHQIFVLIILTKGHICIFSTLHFANRLISKMNPQILSIYQRFALTIFFYCFKKQ